MSVGFYEMSRRAEQMVLRCSSVFLGGSETALIEDLTDGLGVAHNPVKRAAVDALELVEAIEEEPRVKRMLVVRDGQNLRSESLEVLDRRRLDARLRVVVSGKPSPAVRNWFEGRKSFCEVRGPQPEHWGRWWATKTAGRWDYSDDGGWLTTERDAKRAVEFLGGSFGAALASARQISTVYEGPGLLSWSSLRWMIDAQSGEGFVDALLFGSRSDALERAESVSADDLVRVLGLVRWHLKVLWRLRMVNAAGPGGSSRIEAVAGVPLWRWEAVYRPVFARYTEPRLRTRLDLCDESISAARSGARSAVVERLAWAW